jgi:hypothetical protein
LNRIAIALLGAASLAACSPSNRSLLAEAPQGETASVTNPAPKRGAAAPVVAQTGVVGGPAAYNSDNRPIIVRSGLNSDPNNPSGAPGRPWSWNSY